MLLELSRVSQALSDPIRLRILKLLAVQDLCVCELVYLLPASQSRVSQNLAILKYAGLVHDERKGRWVFYSIDHPAVEQALAGLRALLTEPTLEGIPDMEDEASRLGSMSVDNPRGVCQTEIREIGPELTSAAQ